MDAEHHRSIRWNVHLLDRFCCHLPRHHRNTNQLSRTCRLVGAQKRHNHLEERYAGRDEVEFAAWCEEAVEYQRGVGQGGSGHNPGRRELLAVSRTLFLFAISSTDLLLKDAGRDDDERWVLLVNPWRHIPGELRGWGLDANVGDALRCSLACSIRLMTVQHYEKDD